MTRACNIIFHTEFSCPTRLRIHGTNECCEKFGVVLSIFPVSSKCVLSQSQEKWRLASALAAGWRTERRSTSANRVSQICCLLAPFLSPRCCVSPLDLRRLKPQPYIERKMDHLKLWNESRSFSMCDETQGGFRPPPLRTATTYDDDEAFNNVALNLLSRYEALGLTIRETISSTLIQPKDRASFFQGLCARRARSCHSSPSTVCLIQSIDKTFGRTLKAMVDEENSENHSFGYYKRQVTEDPPPITPRHILGPMSSGSGSSMSNAGSSVKKTKRSRRFFPDCDAMGGGLFRSKRVQNIDWKLVSAIEQVDALRLDGDAKSTGVRYEPPRL